MPKLLTIITFLLFMYALLCCCISGQPFPHKWSNIRDWED